MRALSRDRILEIFLNETYFGRGSFGVEAASMSYFGKPLGLLSTDEVACIAMLSRAPLLFDQRKDIGRERRNAVIDKMLQAGLIDDLEAASAQDRPLEFHDRLPKLQKL